MLHIKIIVFTWEHLLNSKHERSVHCFGYHFFYNGLIGTCHPFAKYPGQQNSYQNMFDPSTDWLTKQVNIFSQLTGIILSRYTTH